jgi:hypothetical protein
VRIFYSEPNRRIGVLVAGRECICVIEYLSRRHLTLFALVLGVAGGLMACTINLSINRLLYANWDQQAPSPKLDLQSLHEKPVCTASGSEVPDVATTPPAHETNQPQPCHTAELTPQPHIGLR